VQVGFQRWHGYIIEWHMKQIDGETYFSDVQDQFVF